MERRNTDRRDRKELPILAGKASRLTLRPRKVQRVPAIEEVRRDALPTVKLGAWDHALAVCLAQESLKEIVRLKIKKPGLLSRSVAK